VKLRVTKAAASILMISSAARAQTIVIGQRTVVARTSLGMALVEPHLAVSPTVAQLLVGVVIVTPTDGSTQEKAARQSCRTLVS
jgi:hypothetical protein